MEIRVATDEGFDAIWPIFHEVVGRLLRAFNDPKKGFVDALVMYQWLESTRR
jgi:hypothetical protein